jgi:hypothetical protein
MKAAIAYARSTELRKTNRYRMNASVRFAWASHDGLLQYGEGSTRDINVSGVYVLSGGLPPLGALVQLDIVLPNFENTARGMCLSGEGRVIRCELRDAKDSGAAEGGFAASVQFYPALSDSKFSRFESSGQVLETAVYHLVRTVRNISFGTPTLIRKKKSLSLRSLAAQSFLIAGLASTFCL